MTGQDYPGAGGVRLSGGVVQTALSTKCGEVRLAEPTQCASALDALVSRQQIIESWEPCGE
jgi:hypothetical protein